MGFSIKKTMKSNKGRVMHLLMTDGHSEILEYPSDEENKVDEMVDVLNANTDSDWVYTKVKFGYSNL